MENFKNRLIQLKQTCDYANSQPCYSDKHVSCISIFKITLNQTFRQSSAYFSKSLWRWQIQPELIHFFSFKSGFLGAENMVNKYKSGNVSSIKVVITMPMHCWMNVIQHRILHTAIERLWQKEIGFKNEFFVASFAETQVNYIYSKQIKADKWNKVTFSRPLCFSALRTNRFTIIQGQKIIRDKITPFQCCATLVPAKRWS